MLIVKSIEIKYFRSIFTQRVTNLKRLNVFSGRNDVGKSNILKALNLFFNEETDWNTAFDFYSDYSFKRLNQVRDKTKARQSISIEIEFARPNTYQKSLPDKFKVKRTWYRDNKGYNETNNLSTYSKRGKLPTTLNAANRFLSIFLSEISTA